MDMLVKKEDITNYLLDFHKGNIKQGLGIGCALDQYSVWKAGSLNLILGRNGSGKTTVELWRKLILSVKYNLKWCIWTGENSAGQAVRTLIQMYSGKPFKELSQADIYRYQDEILQWFTFVSNKKLWKYSELLDIFGDGDYNGCLIDPYTGLDRQFDFSGNYEFLNETREWCNKTNVSIDVCTHPNSASGRAGAVYPKGHDWEGHLRIPFQSDVEGGDSFSNRADDFLCYHRLKSHPTMRYYTLVTVYKIKDRETGGIETDFEQPILLEWNYGLGYKVEGVDPLRDKPVEVIEGYQPKELKPDTTFDMVGKGREQEEDEFDIFKTTPKDDIPF